MHRARAEQDFLNLPTSAPGTVSYLMVSDLVQKLKNYPNCRICIAPHPGRG
jgi:hypothetical protein